MVGRSPSRVECRHALQPAPDSLGVDRRLLERAAKLDDEDTRPTTGGGGGPSGRTVDLEAEGAHQLARPNQPSRGERHGGERGHVVSDYRRRRDGGRCAPKPARPWRRSIHAVARPNCLGGQVIVVQALGSVQDRRQAAGRCARARPRSCVHSACRHRTCSAVTTQSNGSPRLPVGGREKVVVAVRDHAQPIAPAQPIECACRIGKGGPVGDGAAKSVDCS